MVTLATPSEETISIADKKLWPAMEGVADRDWLSKGLRDGSYKAREVQKDGKPVYVAFWHVDNERYLVCNGGAWVGEGIPDPWLWTIGLEMLAREQKCRGLRMISRRRALIESTLRRGFVGEGMAVKKDFGFV